MIFILSVCIYLYFIMIEQLLQCKQQNNQWKFWTVLDIVSVTRDEKQQITIYFRRFFYYADDIKMVWK